MYMYNYDTVTALTTLRVMMWLLLSGGKVNFAGSVRRLSPHAQLKSVQGLSRIMCCRVPGPLTFDGQGSGYEAKVQADCRSSKVEHADSEGMA